MKRPRNRRNTFQPASSSVRRQWRYTSVETKDLRLLLICSLMACMTMRNFIAILVMSGILFRADAQEAAELQKGSAERLLAFLKNPKLPRSIDDHSARALGNSVLAVQVDVAIELLSEKSPEAVQFLMDYVTSRSVCLNGNSLRQGDVLERLLHADERNFVRACTAIFKLDGPSVLFNETSISVWRLAPVTAAAQLDTALKSQNWPLSRSLIENVDEKQFERIAPAVRNVLADDNARFRLLAAVALARHGDAAGLAILQHAAKTPRTTHLDLITDDWIVASALEAIYDKGGKAVFVELLDFNEERGAATMTWRGFSAQTLSKHATVDDLEIVEKLSQDETLADYNFALPALVRLEPDKAWPQIQKLFENDAAGASARLWAATMLCKKGNAGALAYLESACSKHLGLGGRPVACLLHAGTPEALTAFRRLLAKSGKPTDPDPFSIGYGFDECSPAELLPIVTDILSCGNLGIIGAFWSRLRFHDSRFQELLPLLKSGLGGSDAEIVECLRSINPVGAELAQARDLVSQISKNQDNDIALAAAALGFDRGWLSAKDARMVCIDHKDGLRHLSNARLFAQVATKDDIQFLQELLRLDNPDDYMEIVRAYYALAIHRINRQ